ncbi:MAG: class I SAM-dependent methyltransferase [Candidatus Sericytochromatia bacterium]
MDSQILDFESLIAGMGFLEIQPDQPVPPPGKVVDGQLQGDLSKILVGDMAMERANLILPQGLEYAAGSLMQLADMPRMCSLAIGVLLFEAVRRLPPEQVYLNIGVWHGFTLLAGMLARPDGPCIGVDDFSEWGRPRMAFVERFARFKCEQHRFFDMDYVKYMRQVHKQPIGVYCFDGPHRELDQSRGLELAHPYIAAGGLIFIDDSNEMRVKAPTLAFVQNHPEYRVIANFGTVSNTHPTWWNGLMILKKDP